MDNYRCPIFATFHNDSLYYMQMDMHFDIHYLLSMLLLRVLRFEFDMDIFNIYCYLVALFWYGPDHPVPPLCALFRPSFNLLFLSKFSSIPHLSIFPLGRWVLLLKGHFSMDFEIYLHNIYCGVLGIESNLAPLFEDMDTLTYMGVSMCKCAGPLFRWRVL